ncbi:hypothetical protein KEH57_04250 [Burkholderia cenocepacia]|uniref:hypothetical protein n=2 Tax=Burkholderia cenocepacia TaxID=95486 RepID=UPI001BA50CD4|nr:hypothetical protein [Burkholderia cenocepacia]QUO26147.1 hypothetical protein KEH57_04250 [Burkholderia cenocepacia]
MMGIPRQLQARLDQYEAQAKTASDTTAATPVAAPGDGVSAATDATPTSAAESASVDASVAATQPAQDAARITPSQPDPDQVDDSAAAPDGAADTFFSDPRYRRMEGRYKAQVKRLEDRVTELTEDARGTAVIADLLAQTRTELAELRAGKPSSATPVEPATPALPELTDEEREMFGDFAPVAEKMIAKSTAPLLAKIAELERQTGAVGQRAMQTDESMFVDRVRAQVPEFDTIVHDPDWPEYTKRKVPFTSITLFDALQDAHNARDIERVTAILNAFASGRAPRPASETSDAASSAPTSPNPSATSSHPAGASSPPAANGLAQFATPDRTAANPASKPSPKFRSSDYQARLSDLRAKRITTTEFQQFDRDFQEAKRAGLVA